MGVRSLRRGVSLLGLAAIVLMAAGCASKGVPVARASGTVTYKGKPVANASISFIPETPGTVPALGKTDENGNFSLSTYGNKDGAPVGKCRVAISLTGPPPPLPPHLAKAEAAAETMQMPGKPLIPKKYFSPDSSGLRVEVVSGKNNVYEFSLEGEITP